MVLRALLFLLFFLATVASQGLLGGLFGGGGGQQGQQGNSGWGLFGNNGGQQGGGWGNLFGGMQQQQQPHGGRGGPQGGPQGQGGGLLGNLGGMLGGLTGQQGGQGINAGTLQGILSNVQKNPAALNSLITQIASIPISIVQSATKVDVVTDMELMKRGPPPSQQEWERKARKFCRRFPGHPNCRGNQVPMYSQLDSMLSVIMGSVSNMLPVVPKVNIKDPLRGVDPNLAQAVPTNNKVLGLLEGSAANSLEGVCRRHSCKNQPPSAIKQRQLVQAKIFDFEQEKFGKDQSDAIQLRFDRTQQLKESLLERANLGHAVVPADNGVFDNDILLTETQAHFMLNELGKGGVGATAPHPELFDKSKDHRMTRMQRRQIEERRRRASVFFEEDPVKMWNAYQPIQYFLDDSLEELEKNDVRGAVGEIQAKTCLRFQEVSKAPTANYMHYYKVESATFCGLSYVGKNDPANPIYLSFGCQNNRGVALHETLHALGIAHQQLRPDRDQYITIDWSNVNPQMYDSFVVVDAKLFTTYGVRYDYGSIMHYHSKTGAIDPNKDTMKPKFDFATNVRRLGQRDSMSAADVELLTKMYCMPGCDDRNVYCGAWALQGLCRTNSWVSNNCIRSCNTCNRGK